MLNFEKNYGVVFEFLLVIVSIIGIVFVFMESFLCEIL